MKKLLLLDLLVVILAALVSSGCTGAGIANALTAAGQDSALWDVTYGGVYGPIHVLRANLKPGQTLQRNIDGTVTIGWVTNAPAIATNAVGTNVVMRLQRP